MVEKPKIATNVYNLKLLKFHHTRSQKWIKQISGSYRPEQHFEVGESVCLQIIT